MSGGSMNYFYCRLEEYTASLGDVELNELVKDLVDVFHDREWFLSGDISEGEYNKTVLKFKEKWFGRPQEERVKAVVDAKIEEILRTLCVAKFCKDCKHWKKENLPYGICKDNKWSNHGYDFACKDFEESEEE